MNRYRYKIRALRALRQAKFHPTAYAAQDLRAAWANGVSIELIETIAAENRGTDVPLYDLIDHAIADLHQ